MPHGSTPETMVPLREPDAASSAGPDRPSQNRDQVTQLVWTSTIEPRGTLTPASGCCKMIRPCGGVPAHRLLKLV